MIANWKLTHRIVLLPSLAGAAFLLSLGATVFLSGRQATVLGQLRQGEYPALEASRDLEVTLARIQRTLEDAAIPTVDRIVATIKHRLDEAK